MFIQRYTICGGENMRSFPPTGYYSYSGPHSWPVVLASPVGRWRGLLTPRYTLNLTKYRR